MATTWITKEMIENAPKNYVYVFGDNLMHEGLGNQAKTARPFVKSGRTFGLPTKIKPDTSEDSYFADRDNEIRAVKNAFREIRELKRNGKVIVFFPSIGEGLAELPRRSPIIYGMIKGFIIAMCENE